MPCTSNRCRSRRQPKPRSPTYPDRENCPRKRVHFSWARAPQSRPWVFALPIASFLGRNPSFAKKYRPWPDSTARVVKTTKPGIHRPARCRVRTSQHLNSVTHPSIRTPNHPQSVDTSEHARGRSNASHRRHAAQDTILSNIVGDSERIGTAGQDKCGRFGLNELLGRCLRDFSIYLENIAVRIAKLPERLPPNSPKDRVENSRISSLRPRICDGKSRNPASPAQPWIGRVLVGLSV